MALSELAGLHLGTFDVFSTDLFDTLLLRDMSGQITRFAEMSGRAAATMHAAARPAIDAAVLEELRQTVHRLAYRVVAHERPTGDVSLTAMHRQQACLLGRDGMMETLRDIELDVDRRHLSANRALLAQLARFAAAGKRVIAVSDTYYTTRDLERLLADVVGTHPIACIYSSSDLGLTKHGGALFAEVARREGVDGARIVHVGDDSHADIIRARAAGWRAVHFPRPLAIRLARKVSSAVSIARRGQPER